MFIKEEIPDFQGGLGDLLPADVLNILNELLELLHWAKFNGQGNTVINIYKEGSLHVEHVDSQNFYGDKWAERSKVEKSNLPALPEVLSTEEAMALWEKVQKAGYVDAHYQPLISRTQAALLADAMAGWLGIKEKWKVFETLWNRKNMYRDYYKALNLQQSLTFQDEIKKLFR